MKNNLENAFKDKLSEFEAPYDPQAWEAVKGKLDAKSTGGSSSAWKWIAATAVVATIAVTSIMLLDPNETTTADVNNVTEEETPNNNIEKSTVKSEDESVTVNHSTNENNGIDANSVHESNTNSGEESTLETNVITEDANPERNVEHGNNVATQSTDDNSTKEPEDFQATATPNKYKYIIGNVRSNEICVGEEVVIINNGAKNEIVRFEVDGKVIELKKANTFTLKPRVSIVINFIDENNKIIDSEYIKVNDLPSPEFTFEANIFEKGLPVTICETYGDYENITWEFDGKTAKEGTKVKHYFFEKGNHPIILNVTDFNGCKNSKEKEVRIDNQYNLMAVDAFKPNDSDHRNKAFMPFSLTQRDDVQFTLTIIDPRDNGTVFTSKEASNPWTGIDERTGKITDSETVFIWKVQIENSLPNERPVYAGTVVHN
jgi:hypothetical protein